jgi:hypothetical protein
MVFDQFADECRIELRPLIEEPLPLRRRLVRELLVHQFAQFGIERGGLEAVLHGLPGGVGRLGIGRLAVVFVGR